MEAHHPPRAYVRGAIDYSQAFADPLRAVESLAGQVDTLRAIGFDGLKLIEGKPMVHKLLNLPLDDPKYAGMWAALEARGFSVVLHLADP